MVSQPTGCVLRVPDSRPTTTDGRARRYWRRPGTRGPRRSLGTGTCGARMSAPGRHPDRPTHPAGNASGSAHPAQDPSRVAPVRLHRPATRDSTCYSPGCTRSANRRRARRLPIAARCSPHHSVACASERRRGRCAISNCRVQLGCPAQRKLAVAKTGRPEQSFAKTRRRYRVIGRQRHGDLRMPRSPPRGGQHAQVARRSLYAARGFSGSASQSSSSRTRSASAKFALIAASTRRSA